MMAIFLFGTSELVIPSRSTEIIISIYSLEG